MNFNTSHAPMVTTKYLAPTNYRGARIKASIDFGHRKASITLDYAHDLSEVQNHKKAFIALHDKVELDLDSVSYSATSNGFAFIGSN